MIVLCPTCGNRVDAGETPPGGVLTCSACQGEFSVPATPPFPVAQRAPRRSAVPVIVPISVPRRNEIDYTDEERDAYRRDRLDKLDERREEREERRDDRQFRKGSRYGNPVGAVGLAFAGAAAIVTVGGCIFAKELPRYAYFVGFLGIMLGLVGLACSMVGCTLQGRPKVMAVTGAAVAGALFIVLIPLLFMLIPSTRP